MGSSISRIKEGVKYIDKIFFGGVITDIYILYLERKKKNFFEKKECVVLNEPVYDTVLMQKNIDSENGNSKIAGYDLAVRYLFVEQFYGLNTCGYDLYKKMHMLRGNYGQINEAEIIYEEKRKKGKKTFHGQGKEEHSIEQFERLIDSCEKNGFRDTSIVMADKNLLNINGSHRLTMALFLKKPFIKTEVHNKVFHRGYEEDWFWSRGFSINEIETIKQKWEQIVEDAKSKIGFYYCILFPPAEKYFDEIVEDIAYMAEDNITLVGYEDFVWEVDEFTNFLRAVYHFDSINARNFKRKLMYILKSSNISNNRVKFRVLKLNIKNPMYRLKSDNGMPESIATVKLKEMVRSRYKVKENKFTEHYEGDYAHDVIIHSSDNYISNNAFKYFLSVPKNIVEIVNVINKYDHVFAITSNDKISESFPNNYYLGEDFDIFVRKEDLSSITKSIYEKCLEVFNNTNYEKVIEESKNGMRVRIRYCDYTITMFDFMIKLSGVKRDYINRFIDEKNVDKITHLSLENEVIYRIAKYQVDNSKEYHLRYLKDVIHNIEFDTIAEAFEMNMQNDIKEIWTLINNL